MDKQLSRPAGASQLMKDFADVALNFGKDQKPQSVVRKEVLIVSRHIQSSNEPRSKFISVYLVWEATGVSFLAEASCFSEQEMNRRPPMGLSSFL